MRDELGDLHSARAIALLRADEEAIRRTAKRFSICAEDAEDAFQRAAEIQAITGWTYTKTNRCLTEGRAQLRELAPLS